MARRIPGIPRHWQDFGLSILWVLVFPALPLLLELGFTGQVRPETLLLTGAIYPVSISASSSNPFLLGISLVISVLLAVAYGRATVGAVPTWAMILSGFSIGLIFVIHGLERYNKHVAGNGEPFPG
jgi:hypothetical protein